MCDLWFFFLQRPVTFHLGVCPAPKFLPHAGRAWSDEFSLFIVLYYR